jgi:hypothetical protein
MGQFSRYILPGDTIYHINKSVLCAANDKELKLVLVNDTTKAKNIFIELSETGKAYKTLKAIRTSGNVSDGECWAEQPDEAISDNAFIAKLKPQSVTTYILT